jgi:hypothetical protein
MSKLEQLQEWFTLEDAAQYISKKIDENITVTTLYRLALDDNLKLSVYFVNGAYGVKGELCKVAGVKNQPQKRFIEEKDNTVNDLKGIWDLTMQGNEAFEIKEYFEKINSGLNVTGQSRNGILLQQDGVICQLYKYFDRERLCHPEYNKSEERRRAIEKEPLMAYQHTPMVLRSRLRDNKAGLEFIPCMTLLEGSCQLVIKSSEVANFIQLLEETPKAAKPLHDKERTTLLTLIGALLKEQDMNSSDRGITPSISLMVDNFGMKMSENTIRNILRQTADITP